MPPASFQNVVRLQQWRDSHSRSPVARITAENLSSTLISRIAAMTADLRQAAISGEAVNPQAALRIAGDLDQVAAEFRGQLAAAASA